MLTSIFVCGRDAERGGVIRRFSLTAAAAAAAAAERWALATPTTPRIICRSMKQPCLAAAPPPEKD